MAQFEYKSIKCHLGWDGEQYVIKDKEPDNPGGAALGLEGWELTGFWPNPIPYITDSYKDAEERELVQIAFFKRQLAPVG